MQVPKSEVRNRILMAAKEAFLKEGFRNVSMRKIAHLSRVTPGNIYSYFPGKDELFKEVVHPVWVELEDLLNIDLGDARTVTDQNISQLMNAIYSISLLHKDEFRILFNGSAGSSYEGIKTRLISLAASRLARDWPGNKGAHIDVAFANALAIALIGGILSIFESCQEDEVRMMKLSEEFLLLLFSNIEQHS